MASTKSESDVTSIAASSPSRTSERPVYFVQSPSRDSQDGDKSISSMQPSPMDSPSHVSFSRHSRSSSGSRFSGLFRGSPGRKNGKKRNDKGWPECNVILEEGPYDEFEHKGFTRRVQALIALFTFIVLFTVMCLIVWGASKPYEAEITVKSLAVHNFYIGEGSDFSGVPTRILTVNGSLKMNIYNPATMFGIHVSSTPLNLVYSEITIATGQLKKYYQPRKSHRTVSVILEGRKVPLYGAGSSLADTPNGSKVPFALTFEIRTQGYVVGKLVRTKHSRQISCPLVIDASSSKPIKFRKNTCTYA